MRHFSFSSLAITSGFGTTAAVSYDQDASNMLCQPMLVSNREPVSQSMQHPEMGRLAWIHIKYGSSILLIILLPSTWPNNLAEHPTGVALNSISGLLCRSTTCGSCDSREWNGSWHNKDIQNIKYHQQNDLEYQIIRSATDGRSCQKLSINSDYQAEYR